MEEMAGEFRKTMILIKVTVSRSRILISEQGKVQGKDQCLKVKTITKYPRIF
jgi:hypothetical protein